MQEIRSNTGKKDKACRKGRRIKHTEGRWKADDRASPGVPPLEARSLPLVAAVQTEAALALPAAEGGVLPPLLHVPAVAAPAFSTTHWKVASAANCRLSPPHRWCSGPADGHLVNCSREGVTLASVVTTNQCLCQLEAEGLHIHSGPGHSWPALPRHDEGIGDTAVDQKPEDVPVVSELTHTCVCFKLCTFAYLTHCTRRADISAQPSGHTVKQR